MLNERFQQVGAALNRPCAGSGGVGEFLDFGDREIGQRISLEIAPKVFDRIEFRSVGRQTHATPLRARSEMLAHGDRPMGRQAIPDRHEGGGQLALQWGQEGHDAAGVDIGVGVQAKVQAHRRPLPRSRRRCNASGLPAGLIRYLLPEW